jgi:hypothetical protein
VDEGGVRGGRLGRLLLRLGHFGVALGKLQSECLRQVGVEADSLLQRDRHHG